MKYCNTCILPNTRPNLTLSEDGKCNACSSWSEKVSQVNWIDRQSQFEKLVKKIKEKEKDWDCVIPVSGGKDSTWQVLKALEYGLKVLCVTWKTPARNDIGDKNLENLISLGVDHIDFSINPKVERLFNIKAFEATGAAALPMHMALFSIPFQIAYKFDIPLVLWGENSGVEYGGVSVYENSVEMNREWLLKFGVTNGTTSEDWISKELTKQDMSPYHWISDESLKKKGITALFLGWFFPWDPVETFEIAKENGFVPLKNEAKVGLYEFADIDDEFLIPIHHWLKWHKFGFTRTWDNLSLEIRAGRLSRKDAIHIISSKGDETAHKQIELFCNWLKMTKTRFNEIAESFRNKDIWKKNNGIWEIDDFLINNWKWK